LITYAFARGMERQILSRWVAEIIWPGTGRDFGNCQAMAVMEDGERICGIIYHNYEPNAGVIEISAGSTSKRWLTRETLKAMFAYPFEEADCQAIVMRCDPDDAALRRMLLAYGFELYVLPRLRGRDKDENVFILTDDAWASNRFNRAKSSQA